jgi:protocatechuate 3,4-dioxygenase beta subunit
MATPTRLLNRLTRRRLLVLGISLPLPAFLVACSDDEAPQPAATATPAPQAAGATSAPALSASATSQPQLAATPECGDDDDDATIAQTEGPYFTPNSPERASLLESGVSGTRLTITGFVLSTACMPVARALVDFWQCDGAGVYDNSGFKLRGHQFTDPNGRYQLTTIVPGVYTGRTRHIHVKVQAPNRPVLTTQLYFPNEPQNARDGIYNAALVLDDYADASGGAKTGAFTFVLNV